MNICLCFRSSLVVNETLLKTPCFVSHLSQPQNTQLFSSVALLHFTTPKIGICWHLAKEIDLCEGIRNQSENLLEYPYKA